MKYAKPFYCAHKIALFAKMDSHCAAKDIVPEKMQNGRKYSNYSKCTKLYQKCSQVCQKSTFWFMIFQLGTFKYSLVNFMSRSFTPLTLEAEFVSYVRNRIRLRPGVLTFDRIKAKVRDESG